MPFFYSFAIQSKNGPLVVTDLKKKKKSDRGIFFTSPKQYCNNWSLQGTLTSKETKMMKVFSLLLDILMLLDGGTKIIFAI